VKSRPFVVAVVALVLAGCLDVAGPKPAEGGCPADEPCSDFPIKVIGGHQFTKLTAGKFHTCGLTANGEIWCWGLNSVGQLGAITDEIGSGVPVKVGGDRTYKTVTGGELHTCAIGDDDGAYCWGINSGGVLGVTSVAFTCGGSPCSPTPVRAAGSFTFSLLDAGASHTCGVRDTGNTVCWGFNVFGEIGSANFGLSSTQPVSVSTTRTFTQLTAAYRFNCALDAGAELSCWGAGEEGQLATPAIDACQTPSSGNFKCSPTPVVANTSLRFTTIATGAAFGCGISTDGSLHCWGYNGQGQLGTDDFVTTRMPVSVKATGTWTSVAAGYFHACALRGTGEAYCWGVNNSAQLGDSSKIFFGKTPRAVGGGKTFSQIVAGANHTCGLTVEGDVWCWGGDFVFQLGRG
jgi:alpha-tubulin suppressor-like RCC1 family protein